ncbi:pilus (MSHA type) biogenesis protein MshL [Aquabacterium sp. OR-4]|uniref:pilus (MSHA type) biogenesis protein MshL n=1 Tax=Aquabacterium sp. OR-4 TaxID=2978127 RepID=UPI0028C5E934|nr:pilus (MSHA type) biogenesis protein MshL [Aquabacterium sp. OR-4]MDT7836884.1 pilus (MSHA type) biogenesis protein MshL [Aquabacterium sp. OR-4]
MITARAMPRIVVTPLPPVAARSDKTAHSDQPAGPDRTDKTEPAAADPNDSAAALAPSQVTPAPAQAAAQPLQLAAAAPNAPRGLAEPRFDLSVNNAPAAQVFLQLAQGTHYNMLVSPEVAGTLSITLKDTSVPEALDTLRELFGYDFRIAGNRIFVYSNAVQTRLYRVNYLPGRRQGESDLRVTSSAITQTSGPSSSSGNSSNGGMPQRPNDNAQVRTTSDANFWQEVQSSLVAMVGSQGGRSVVLNPAAGVVVVRATPAELRQVEGYLKVVQLAIERQVMLEAKIIEVVLSKDAQSGVNWAGFGKLPGSNTRFSVGTAAPGTTLSGNASVPLTSADGTRIAPGLDIAAGSLGRGFYGLAFQAANFAALLNFLETQGSVQVLSSPRIATLNNQKAVLKVGSDELYVTGITSSTTTAGNNAVSSPSVTLQPFFSGISLDVTPQIDEAGNVMLHVHPTISVVTEKSKNIDLGALGNYKLPLAASTVNETDSIVRVRDGQIVAIGGLMKQESHNERTGMPVLSDAPVVGNLFKQTSVVTSKRELVILLKPSVIRQDGPWPEAMPVTQ